MKPVFRILGYYRPFAGRIFGAFLLLGLATGLNLLKPWPLKFIIDSVLSGQPVRGGVGGHFSPGALILLACVALVLIYLSVRVVNQYEQMVVFRLGRTNEGLVRGPGLQRRDPPVVEDVAVDQQAEGDQVTLHVRMSDVDFGRFGARHS